jgi:DNA-binding response OmpR family regulator
MIPWDEILKRANVLIVDADATSRDFLQRLLQQAGYRKIRATANPREAIDWYREEEPDLVLLDLHIPEIPGLELLQRFAHESDPRSFVPLVVITAEPDSTAKLNALLLGAKDFLPKPIDAVEALLRIRMLLEIRFRFAEMESELAHLRLRRAESG